MFKRMCLITIHNANVSTCDYYGDEVRASNQNGKGCIASSHWINLIDVMSSNDALHSVLFHDLVTFNTWNARTRSMAPPSMSKPFLLSAHSLLSACFLLSAYFLAVHSYKRMCLTTSVYGSLTSTATGTVQCDAESLRLPAFPALCIRPGSPCTNPLPELTTIMFI